jgi:hypothetical protein
VTVLSSNTFSFANVYQPLSQEGPEENADFQKCSVVSKEAEQ